MAEANTAELEAKVDAAFGAGFGDLPPEVVAPPAPDAVVADAPLAEVVAPPKPEYVRLTKQDWDNAKAAVGKVASLESQVARLSGSLPDPERIAQQVIDKVRASTPAGGAVELTDEDFAGWKETFPEIGDGMRATLDKIVKRMNVNGAAQPRPAAQSAEVAAVVREILTKRESEDLEEAHPDWSDIVGRPAQPGVSPTTTPFRLWLADQPEAYQQKVGTTRSPFVVRSAIDRFKANQSAPSTRPDRAAVRRAVIEGAVTPRADGNSPSINAPLTAEDAFGSGFKAVKRH